MLTVGSVLLTVELLSLQLYFFLHAVRFLLTVEASLLTVGAFLLTVGSASNEHLNPEWTVSKEAQL